MHDVKSSAVKRDGLQRMGPYRAELKARYKDEVDLLGFVTPDQKARLPPMLLFEVSLTSWQPGEKQIWRQGQPTFRRYPQDSWLQCQSGWLG